MVKNNLFNEVQVHDEIFMVDLDADKYYTLNPTASYVWSMLYVPISIEELRQKLLQRYHVGEDSAINALNNLLHEMIKRKMILACDEE